MTTTDIAQHVREMHDAWLVGDFDTAFASYAEDAIVHLGGRGLFSGTHHGKQRLMELSRQLHSAVDFSGRVIDVLADDDHGVAIYEATLKRDGKSWTATFVWALKLDADGRWKEGWYATNDQAGEYEFWTS